MACSVAGCGYNCELCLVVNCGHPRDQVSLFGRIGLIDAEAANPQILQAKPLCHLDGVKHGLGPVFLVLGRYSPDVA